MKVSVGVGLGGNPPTCVECGERHVPFGLVVGLHTEPDASGAMESLGEFCEQCAGRFAQIDSEGGGPLEVGVQVDEQELRAAIIRTAKRLRKLARSLDNAELVRD